MFLLARSPPNGRGTSCKSRASAARAGRLGKACSVNNFGKNLALWIVIGLLLVALFNLFQTSSTRGPQSTLAFSDFVTDVNRGQVTDVTIQGNSISGQLTTGQGFTTYAPSR